MTAPTLERTFRSYADSEWNPESDMDSRPLSAVAFGGLPFAAPAGVEHRTDLDLDAAPEFGPHTPLGYHFAAPAEDPAITGAPRMGSHPYIYGHTSCNGHVWIDSLCGHD